MDALECLFTRRSIRKYTAEPINETSLRKMLAAAMAAPSARNIQPVRFIVIRDRELLQRISEISPYARMAEKAPLAVLVCGDSALSAEFWDQDCAAAMQNLLLAARALHIGTVWCGVHPAAEREASFRELFHIPPHIIPFGLAVAGYPAQSFSRRDALDESRIHLDRW